MSNPYEPSETLKNQMNEYASEADRKRDERDRRSMLSDFAQAMYHMTDGAGADPDRDETIKIIHDYVAPLCKTPINPSGETSLYDWLCAGDWSNPKQTALELAQEWDSLAQE